MKRDLAHGSTTTDWFHGDRLLVQQPTEGFRAGTDSLLLAAAVRARAGQRVLELGAGVGVASLSLSARVRGLDMTLVELEPVAAALAQQNFAQNTDAGRIAPSSWHVMHADALSKALLDQPGTFDVSFCNPPYFDASAGRASPNRAKNTARQTSQALADWVVAMARWTKNGGQMAMICRAQSLADVLTAFERQCGGVEVLPIYPKPGSSAINLLLRGIKGRRSATQILPGIVIRDTASKISPVVERIQRFGTDTL